MPKGEEVRKKENIKTLVIPSLFPASARLPQGGLSLYGKITF
jgi:hypothetical protein